MALGTQILEGRFKEFMGKTQISVDFSKYVIWLSTWMMLCISRHELDSL